MSRNVLPPVNNIKCVVSERTRCPTRTSPLHQITSVRHISTSNVTGPGTAGITGTRTGAGTTTAAGTTVITGATITTTATGTREYHNRSNVTNCK